MDKKQRNKKLRNKEDNDDFHAAKMGKNRRTKKEEDFHAAPAAEHSITSLGELVTAVNDKGRKWSIFHGERQWTLYRNSKPSKKKMIASLIAWSQNLSQQLHESYERERELQHENEDLKCHRAQSEERLLSMKEQVTHHKAKEVQLEHKLETIENNARTTEDEVKTKQQEFERAKQQLQSETAKLKGEIKGKEEIINHTEDALKKCRHDCNNKETKYLTVKSEKSRLEDKLQSSADKTSYLQSEIERLHEMLKTEEKQHNKLQLQLQKDLTSTRRVLNDSYRDKDIIEKQMSTEIEAFKYQVFMLSKALHETKLLAETLKKEKQMLMFYYQDKLSTLKQNKTYPEQDANTPAICSSSDKSVQESYLQSTANILKNKVLDLEFNIYRYEKLTEGLVDVIQSHDPDFVLEEEEILKSYLDQNKASSSESEQFYLGDQYLEPGCSDDLDLYSGVPEKSHDTFENLVSSMSMDVSSTSINVSSTSIDVSSTSTDTLATTDSHHIHTEIPRKNPYNCEDLVPSISTDTCSTADSLHSGMTLAESVDIDTYETSTKYSESDTTCSLYSDFPTNGSS